MQSNWSNKKKWFIISPFIAFIVFKISSFPVYIDEATTFLEYSSQGFWTTLTTYNEPNNHVFFSLLATLAVKLPIDPLIAMRLINLVLSIICLSLLYDFLKKKFSETSTLIAFTFFVFSYAYTFYSIFARGYLLIILFTLISFLLIDKIQDKFEFRFYFLFGLVTTLGFFTIPIYLYVSLSFGIILIIQFWKDKKKLMTFIITYFISGIGVFILYLPIIYFNGIKSITNNEYSQPKLKSEVIDFLKTSWFGFYDKIFGVQSGLIFMALIGISMFHLIRKNTNKQIDINLLVFLIIPFLGVYFQNVIPGFRTWIYVLVPITIALASYIENYEKNVNENLKWLTTVLLLVTIPIIQVKIFNKSNPYAGRENDIEANRIARFLKSIPERRNLLFLDGKKDYDIVIYLFERERNRKNNKIFFDHNLEKQPKNTIIISKKAISSSNKIVLIKKFKTKFIYKLM